MTTRKIINSGKRMISVKAYNRGKGVKAYTFGMADEETVCLPAVKSEFGLVLPDELYDQAAQLLMEKLDLSTEVWVRSLSADSPSVFHYVAVPQQ
jgi:hypothetical protein